MKTTRHEVHAYGITCLLASHPAIRKLKRTSPTTVHGTRQWPSSWLLIDYLSRHPLARGVRIMEIGAGWGLTGIYCARRFDAEVVAVDMDPAVFPYLKLHADLNGVEIRAVKSGFARIDSRLLARTDVVVGSDICFWRSLIPVVRGFVLRALRCGVERILLADPARTTFETMATTLVRGGTARVLDWRAGRPLPRSGRILVAQSLPGSDRAPILART